MTKCQYFTFKVRKKMRRGRKYAQLVQLSLEHRLKVAKYAGTGLVLSRDEVPIVLRALKRGGR